jgi:hypothetical protein
MAAVTLRLVPDNLARRLSSITANSVSGALAATNLMLDRKSRVYRSAAGVTAVTISGNLAVADLVSTVQLLNTNLSPTAQIQAQLFSQDNGAGVKVYDSFVAWANQAPAIKLQGFTDAQAASAYAYGGGTNARVWLNAPVTAKSFIITITDTSNLQGCIEASHLVIGAYWAPANGTADAAVTWLDNSEHYQMGDGDLMSRLGTMRKKMVLRLDGMPVADRVICAGYLRQSRVHPVLACVFPEHADQSLDREYTIYGKRASDSDVGIQNAINYGTPLTLLSL